MKNTGKAKGALWSPRGLTELYVSALFLLLPLFYRNGYFDITESKALCFLVLSALYLAALTLRLLFGRSRAGEERGMGPGSVCMAVFALVSVLASLLSGYAASALLAADNRYQGVVMFLFYLAVFRAVERFGVGHRVRYAAAAGFAAVCALAALNHLGADPLGLLAPLRASDRGRFLSTVGNVNFLGAYVALLLPAALAWLCLAEKARQRVVPGLLALLGTWALMCASESALLGTLAGLAFLPLLLGRQERAFRRAPLLLCVLSLSMAAFCALDALWGAGGFSVLTALLLHPAVCAALFFLGLGLWAWLRRVGSIKRAVKVYAAALGVLLALLVLALLLINRGSVSVPERLRPYVMFGPDWGTDRGGIWMSCRRLYESYPLWQKLLGGGAGVLARWDALHRIFPDALVDSAHNEYLHYLLTSGLLGLGGYLGVLGAAFRAGWRAQRPESAALLAALVSYAVQSAVNIAQCATTPLFFVLLALLCRQGGAAETGDA